MVGGKERSRFGRDCNFLSNAIRSRGCWGKQHVKRSFSPFPQPADSNMSQQVQQQQQTQAAMIRTAIHTAESRLAPLAHPLDFVAASSHHRVMGAPPSMLAPPPGMHAALANLTQMLHTLRAPLSRLPLADAVVLPVATTGPIGAFPPAVVYGGDAFLPIDELREREHGVAMARAALADAAVAARVAGTDTGMRSGSAAAQAAVRHQVIGSNMLGGPVSSSAAVTASGQTAAALDLQQQQEMAAASIADRDLLAMHTNSTNHYATRTWAPFDEYFKQSLAAKEAQLFAIPTAHSDAEWTRMSNRVLGRSSSEPTSNHVMVRAVDTPAPPSLAQTKKRVDTVLKLMHLQ
ncbi:hypothetical protein BC828DRAFT_7214 [Blastocladiella britannica]|nr:hypothetical protein BC828DRAFT_7214 [Blastocladiella britannica]